MTHRQLTFDFVEDYLGNPATRFFGAGYRRAEYQVRDVLVTPGGAGEAGAQATVAVEYPRDWSKKTGEIDVAPHLSSIDTLLLGVQLSEAYLAHADGLGEEQRARAWLRRVNLQAGMSPQEDLVDLPASAKLLEKKPAPDAQGVFVSVFDCRIGAMRARCEIEHEVAKPAGEPLRRESLDDFLGLTESRYYGDGFKFRRHVIKDVRADLDELVASALIEVVPDGEGDVPGHGIEGEYQPTFSTVDCFVINLQLAQVLMYEMDGLRREDSNTLWMLRTAMSAEKPQRPCATPLTARVSVRRSDLLRLRGGIWRNVELAGECGGIVLGCSLAHELPAGAAVAGHPSIS